MTTAKTDTQHSDDAREQVPTNTGAGLPHERDEKSGSDDATGSGDHPRAPIKQAHDDVESGIQDTERIGTPNDVPSSADQR